MIRDFLLGGGGVTAGGRFPFLSTLRIKVCINQYMSEPMYYFLLPKIVSEAGVSGGGGGGGGITGARQVGESYPPPPLCINP